MKTSGFKKYKLVIFTIITIFLLTIKVDAATCSSEEKNNLIKLSKNIEIIPYLDEDYNPMHQYFYSVNITNFSKEVYVIDSKGNRFEYEESYNDDYLFGLYKPGETVTFKAYGAYGGNCPDTILTTFLVKFDYYNDYSTYKECEGIGEFYLCKRNYSGTIESEEWFLNQIDKYKKGEIENIDIEPKEEKNVIKEFFSNKVVQISLVLVFLFIVFIATRIYIKSKTKIKIDIKKKG
jgi:hypothetical protein